MEFIFFLLLTAAGVFYLHQDACNLGAVRPLSVFGFCVGLAGLIFQVFAG